MPTQQSSNIAGGATLAPSYINNLVTDVTALWSAAALIAGATLALPVPSQPYVVLEVCCGGGITVGTTTADGYLMAPGDQPWTATRQGRTTAYDSGSTTSTTDAVGFNKLYMFDLPGPCSIDRYGGRLNVAIQRGSSGTVTMSTIEVQLVKIAAGGAETLLDTTTVSGLGSTSTNDIAMGIVTFDRACPSTVTLAATDRLAFRIKITGRTSTGTSAAIFYLNFDDREFIGSTWQGAARGSNRSRLAVRFA